MHFLTIISFVVLSVYCMLIFSFLKGWYRLRTPSPVKISNFPFVSVVVAFRNEEINIGNLLHDLLHQDYPPGNFEIILVNDHSLDFSHVIAESFRTQCNCQLTVISAEEGKTGKKWAVDSGIKASQGELILTTDADCRVPQTWLSAFANFYCCNNEPEMVIGLVDFKEVRTIFNYLQNLEFLSLIGCGAGAAGIGKPIYCNAANLMFKRRIYFEIYDPLNKSVVSGDDTFLLHHIKEKYPSQIKVLKSTDAVVTTNPPSDLKEFINQRLRWGSKGRYYSDKHIIFTGLTVLLINITLFFWISASFFFPEIALLYLFALKIITDWLMITPVLNFFNKKKLHMYVPLLSLIYPFYVLVMIVISFFSDFTWKDRVYKQSQ